MPHLRPARVLEEFSSYLQSEVRPAIDDEFVSGQVGSMSSTLSYLARELAGKGEVTERQRATLEAGLREVAEECDDEAVRERATAARERVTEAAEDDPNELEATLVEVANDVLDAINAELDGAAARAAREPLYEFLRVRVEGQLEMLGRDAE